MSTVRPFKGIRPRRDLAASIAALPYDVYNTEEARVVVEANPLSFLKIDVQKRFSRKGSTFIHPKSI